MGRFESLPLPQRAVIIFLVLAGAAGGYFFMFIEPIKEGIAAAQAKLVRTENTTQSLHPYEDEGKLKLLEEDTREIADKLEANKALLPSDEKIPSLITAIKRQADERGLKILKFKKHDRILDDYVAFVPVQMIVQASYPVVISFLEALAQPGMRMMTVTEIQLKSLPVDDFVDTGFGELSEAEKNYADAGVGGARRASANTDPLTELIAKFESFENALERYQIRAKFVVNAYSYTGRLLTPEERVARDKAKGRSLGR